ncbi:MAG TPA: tetratricopeptide repeat protein, partial [Candidatus Binatia bacterium]|nr:tetratricopeptide repeat protein [Candidatus Binatia bacterium]
MAASAPVYLFGPGIDLGLIAGGLTFALFPLCFLIPSGWSVTAFLVLNVVCNYPHYMATNYRIYGSRSQIERYEVLSIHVTGLLLATALLAHVLTSGWIRVLYTVYLTWSPYHYSGQNYGIALMYLRRSGVEVTPRAKRLLYLATLASFLSYFVFINMRSTGTIDAAMLQLGIPAALGRGLYVVLLAAALVCGGWVVVALARRAPLRLLVPAVLLLATQLTWFSVLSGVGIFAPLLGVRQLRFESLLPAMAFLHCAQYLGITAYYAKREGSAEGRSFRLAPYFAALVLGGIFLWLGTTRLLAEVFAVDYNHSFLVMAAIINIHHFIMDGAIWKLRDGRIARLLIAPDARAAAPAPMAGVRLGQGWKVAGWGLAAVLAVALATTDVAARIFLGQARGLADGNHFADARPLFDRVLGLNRRTVAALDGAALASMHAGDMKSAETLWRQSIALAPRSAHSRGGLGETYLLTGRIDDAIRELEGSLAVDPDHLTTLSLL